MEQTQADRDEHELHFFYWIGRCVTRYQAIEDYLVDIFRKSSNLSDLSADRIFKTAQGVERKLELISAVVSEREADWERLRTRIAGAAHLRNQIAHSGPTYGGQQITIIRNTDPDTPAKVVISGKPHFTLRKLTKSGEQILTIEQLKESCQEFDKLFKNLIAFVHILENLEVPEHLLDGYN
jgi:hypothetical protein